MAKPYGYGYGYGSGYGAGRIIARYSVAFYAAVVVIAGVLFVGLASIFSIPQSVIMLFLGTVVIVSFVKGELLLYAILPVFMLPVPMRAGPAHFFPVDIIFVLMLIAVAVKAAVNKRIVFPPSYYSLICVVFVILVAASSLRAANIMSAMPEIIQFLYYLIVMPVLVMNLTSGNKHIFSVVRAFVLLMILQSLLIIAQFNLLLAGDTTITALFPYANRGGVDNYILRSYGSIGPAAGIFLTVGIIVLLADVLDVKSHLAVKIFGSAGILIMLYATFCTGMRSALGVTAALVLFLALIKKRFAIALFMTFVILGTSLFIVTTGKDVYPFKLFYGHAGHRSEDVDKALDVFQQNILLGVGPQQFKRDRAWGEVAGVENELVRRLVEGGIFNAALFLLWIAAAIYMGARSARSPGELTASNAVTLVFTFLVFVLNGLFAADLFDGGHGHLMMFIVGMILAVWADTAGKMRGPYDYYHRAT